MAALLATAIVVAGLAPGARTAGLPPLVAERLGVNLGTALVLSGQDLAVGPALAASRALRALGRRPNLTRVHALPRLREGAEGGAVRLLQARLDGLGDDLAQDGVFGPETLAALDAFERSHAVTPLGTVDAAVWRLLLGTPVGAAGRSVWALSSAYATSPASLRAWNADLPAEAGWGRPVEGEVWLMPPDVRPSAVTLGTGRFPVAAAPGRATSASAASTGRARSRPDGQPGAVMVLLAVPATASVGAVEALAAFLGGRGLVVTVALPVGLVAGRGAEALALEGEDVGVALAGRAPSAPALVQSVLASERATGDRPAVAYDGLYPSAAGAREAAGAGLALVVGASGVPASRPAAGAVYVLTGSVPALEHAVLELHGRVRAAGERLGAVRSALSLDGASA